MIKPSKPSTQTVKTVVLAIVAIGLVAWGLVLYQQHRVAAQAKANQAAVINAQSKVTQAKQVQSYQSQLRLLNVERTNACAALKQVTTKPRVAYVTPDYCQ